VRARENSRGSLRIRREAAASDATSYTRSSLTSCESTFARCDSTVFSDTLQARDSASWCAPRRPASPRRARAGSAVHRQPRLACMK